MSRPARFSFPSYRSLRRYLGETDALVELTELAARCFLTDASESGNTVNYVKATSAKQGICVNLSEVDALSAHLSRSYIVNVYHSAERFLHEFRQEHVGLYQKDWSGDGIGVDPLTITLKNIASSQADAERYIGPDLITRFQYYRIVRNWIVHTKDSDSSKPKTKFIEIVGYSSEHAELFRAVKAPNRPENLNFDDFVFLSRLTKTIAEKICRIAEPGQEHWNRLMTEKTFKRFKRLSNNPDRMRNAVTGRIKTEYGMDESTAKWIANELCDSLA